MAFNGSGVFVRLYNWVNDAAANIKIRADRMDAEFNGIATGLTNCITKDGQTTVTANLPMGGFKHTGVANASANNEYAAFGQIATAISAITLDNLSDVVITSLASGDHIYYNGTNWVNVEKNNIPVSGLKANTSSGVVLKNSGGTTVLTAGASAGTVTELSGNLTVAGTIVGSSTGSVVGSFDVTGTASSPAYITMGEDTDSGTNKVTVIAPASIASDYTVTLPSAAGTIALTSDINSSGLSKAWVSFNGTGTVAIRASYNVSSITDNGTGDYTVNFTTPFSSAEYAASMICGQGATGNNYNIVQIHDTVSPTASAFRVQTKAQSAGTPTAFDMPYVMLTFFGAQ